MAVSDITVVSEYDNNNLEIVRNKCVESMRKAENSDPKIKEIRETVVLAKAAKKGLDFLLQFNKNYNLAAERLNALRSTYKEAKTIPADFNGESREAYVAKVFENKTKEAYDNYKKAGKEKDEAYIQKRNEELGKAAMGGYKVIMNLRRLITNQDIIYAVQGRGGGTLHRHLYLEEEDFLELLIPRSEFKGYYQIMKEGNFEKSYLRIGYKKINEMAKETENAIIRTSRDGLYQRIAEYLPGPKSKKLDNWQAWEAYTEARAYFGDMEPPDPDEIKFRDFMGEFLKRTVRQEVNGVIYGSYDLYGRNSGSGSLDSLRFYQGGDTLSSYGNDGKYVMVQNKSSGSEAFAAGIRIPTIHNALKYIVEVFKGGEVKVEDVQKIFTAYGLQLTKGIVNDAFMEANTYAQKQIEKNIKALNAKGGVTFEFD